MPNALQPSSGTQAFNPSFGDMILEAFARIQIRPPALTADHFFQARMSMGLLQSELANLLMPMLWKVTQLKIPLIPGQRSYTLPTSVIAPLDGFIRVYQPANPANFAPVMTAAANSTSLQVTWPAHGLATDQMVWFATQQTASGVVLQGTQLVTSIIDQNNFELTLPTPADGTNTVVLPVFYTTLGSSTVTIFLPAHGLANGQFFYLNVPITVGGIELNGQFTVIAVPTPDSFQIQAPQPATSTVGSPFLVDDHTGRILTNSNGYALTNGPSGQILNNGQVQTQTQAYGVDLQDYILYPVSRTEYVTQPDKQLQFRPTTWWFNRQVAPIATFWNAPDNNSPYVFHQWIMQQPDDPVVGGGVGVDVPFRFLDAFAAGLACRLYRKFPPPPAAGIAIADLRAEYQASLDAANKEDIERVPLALVPGLDSYFR
jgi:hypothetical protein